MNKITSHIRAAMLVEGCGEHPQLDEIFDTPVVVDMEAKIVCINYGPSVRTAIIGSDEDWYKLATPEGEFFAEDTALLPVSKHVLHDTERDQPGVSLHMIKTFINERDRDLTLHDMSACVMFGIRLTPLEEVRNLLPDNCVIKTLAGYNDYVMIPVSHVDDDSEGLDNQITCEDLEYDPQPLTPENAYISLAGAINLLSSMNLDLLFIDGDKLIKI